MDRLLSPDALAAFLARQDPVWTELPRDWDEGPFLGNGCTGALFYAPEGRAPFFKPGRTDIYDNRPLERYTIMDKQFAQPRLQLGELEVVTAAPVTGMTGRLSLYDARFDAELRTGAGTVALSAYVPRGADALVVDLCARGGETASLRYLPAPAESPRQTKMREFGDAARYRADYAPPKAPLPVRARGDALLFEQPLFTSGSYTVCLDRPAPGRWVLAAAVSDGDGSAEAAYAAAEALRYDAPARAAHLAFWHGLYERSFFSASDPLWENFYWVQIYKMACAARPGGRIIDTMGPWAITTSWPAAFWNLNVQLTYAPMIPTGLFDVCRSLPDTLWARRGELSQNVDPRFREGCCGIGTNTCRTLRSELAVPGEPKAPKEKVEAGNLTWALFVAWTLCRTTADDRMLAGEVLPLLAGCVRYYLRFLSPDAEGVLHLAATESPEYLTVDEDTNYDLALLRWGLSTLIAEHERLGGAEDELPVWRDALSRLTPFPEDPEEGLMIAAHTRLSASHRHYSHLLAFYPLHLLDPGNAEDRARILRSVAHWHSMPEKLEGYSQTGAASMLALLGDGDRAVGYLDALMAEFIRPNTMYREEGGPVLETPLAAVSSIADMLLQSFGGTLRVFPACPARWADVSFRLYAEGGFTVSAVRRKGRLQFVRVESAAGAPCALTADFDGTPVCDAPFSFDGRVWRVDLPAGACATLRVCPEEEAVFDAPARGDGNFFGRNGRTYGFVHPLPHHVRRGKVKY